MGNFDQVSRIAKTACAKSCTLMAGCGKGFFNAVIINQVNIKSTGYNNCMRLLVHENLVMKFVLLTYISIIISSNYRKSDINPKEEKM